MDCGNFSLKATPAAEEDENGEKGVQMVASELEAAEALAGLAQCSAYHCGGLGSGELGDRLLTVAAVVSTLPSQDQPIAVQQFCGHASTTVSNPEKTGKNILTELCSTCCQSNSAKFRRNLTEAEKEARKLRRILANRESARQTIRRRQAMYLELTRKAADLLEDNENLKKQKELSVEKYNSLKSQSEFLKAWLAKIKTAEQAEKQEEPKTSQSGKSCSAATTNPVFLHDQSSIVPCFWPSFFPLLDFFQSQWLSHPNVMSSSQFPMPHRQQNSMGISGPGTPLCVLPVPWLLSFLAPSSSLHSNSGLNDRQNAHQCSQCSYSGNLLHEDNNKLSSNQNARAEDSNSVKSMSCSDINVISAPESMRNLFSHKNPETIIHSHGKSKVAFAATEARRRRKELMKLKNINCQAVRRR